MKTTRTEHTSGQRLFALLLAALMVFGMVPVTGAAATTGGITTDGVRTDVNSITTVADPETLTRPETIYGNNTLNAGKVTVGKSVSTTNVTVNGQTVTLDDPDNFLVTISQSAQVMGLSTETSVPVDVVFVLDTSGSMDENNRETTMVTAANNAIRTLMAANPNNRVGVVAFSDIDGSGSGTEPAAQVLSNLASYTGTAATNHLTWSNGDIVGRGNGSGSRDGSNGGTNIQAGVVMGAKMLASATNLTVDGVTRMPFLIILSDGAPTYNFTNSTWYDPSMTGSQYGPGNDQGTLYTGNGFLPALVAAYYKGVITEHYYGTNASEENRCNIYTLGVSIDNSNLARLTMDPKTNFNANATNNHSGRFATYWRNYQAGNTFSISCGDDENLSITKTTIDATKNYVNGISSTGKFMYTGGIQYNDGYYSATSTSQIEGIFDQVLMEISKKAISAPTHVGSYGEDFSGYVTFYDPIGEYMEVKDMKGIVANGYFYQGASAAAYMASGTNAEFNNLIAKVLTTRLSMTASTGVTVNELLATANGTNSITWWGLAYDTGDEDPGMQVLAAAENDTIEYIETATNRPANATHVCRSYFFYGEAGGANPNPDHQYLYFVVRVQRSLTAPYQQTVVISAPASLLSMEKVLITESTDDNGNTVYSASVEAAAPARVVYEVGLRGDITAENVSTIVSSAYKSEAVNGDGSVNYDAATDTYTFFTNDWDRSESLISHHRAMAHATFDAAADNAFYTYQQNTLIVDASGNAVTSNPAGTTAYYVREYYEWGTTTDSEGNYTATKKTELIKVDIPAGSNLVNTDGKWYIPKGAYTAATLVVNGDDKMKDDLTTAAANDGNKTGTSSIVAHPHRTGDASNSHYTVYLGNNGKLTLKANTPKPEKTVTNVTQNITNADGAPVMVGEVLSYTVKAINTTAETGTVTITDTVPAGTDYVAGTAAGTGVANVAVTETTDSTGKVTAITWTFTNVAPGGEVSASFNVKVTEAALETSVGYIQNQATATIGGNSYQTNIVTNPPEGKKVTTTSTNGTVKVGDRLTYSIEFHNDAKNTAGEYVDATVTIKDYIPAGTTFVSADHGGVYDSTTNTITWTLENVTANMGGVVTFVVEVNASAQTPITNGATIQVGNRNPSTNTTYTELAKGNLSLKKLLAEGDSTNRTFELTLTESTGLLNGTYSGVTFTNGVAPVTISADQTITIENLPAGISIVVVETAADGWTPSYSSNSVAVTANGTASVTVTNDYYAEPVKFQLQGTKTFVGSNFPNGTFIFRAQECTYDATTGAVTVVPNGIAVDAVATYETDGSADIMFSERTFAAAIDRYYLVTESATTIPGVTTDGSKYLLHLVTKDNKQGAWELTYTLSKWNATTGQWDPLAAAADQTGTVVAGGAAFTNTYKAAPVSITISGTKSLTGRYLKENDFSFQLVEGSSVIATATNGNGTAASPSVGSFAFPAITYTEAGDHTYYIREVTSSPAANTGYDYNYYQVSVSVTDDGNGQLKATYSVHKFTAIVNGSDISYPSTGTELVKDATDWTLIDDYIGYANTFTAPDAFVELSGTKKLTGEGADGTAHSFSFSVYKSDENGTKGDLVSVGSTNVSNTADINFAKIGITIKDMRDATLESGKYTKTFYFLVEEDQLASNPNMYNDPALYLAQVKVTYDPDLAKLEVDQNNIIYKIKSGNDWVNAADNKVVFENILNSDYVTVKPAGNKNTTGTALPGGLRFSFRVTSDEAGTVLAGTGMSIGTDGTDNSTTAIEFTELVITDEMFEAAKNAAGTATFTYYIRESNTASNNGVDYDETVFKYEVTVTRNQYNKLVKVDGSEKYYEKNPSGEWVETTVLFENRYAAKGHIDLTAGKSTDSTFVLTDDAFDFRLQRLATDGRLTGAAVNGTNNNLGKVTFATLNFSNEMLQNMAHYTPDGGTEYWLVSYLMSEIKPDTGAIPGVLYDQTQYIVTIKLTRNATNTEQLDAVLYSVYEAEANGDVYTAKNSADITVENATSATDTGVTFTNTYSVQTGTNATIEATKTLTGRALAEGEFGFNLSRYDAATSTWKNIGTAFNGSNGSISFTRYYNASTLSHLASGFIVNSDGDEEFTVKYRLEEVNNNLGGVSYSGKVYYVQVVIVHDEDTASYTLKSGYPKYFTDEACTEEATEVVFANSYDTNDTHFTPEASKVLLGRNNTAMSPAGFSFEVIEVDENGTIMTVPSGSQQVNKVVSTGTSDANGKVTFSDIHYTNETHCTGTTCTIDGCACGGTGKVHSHFYTIVEMEGTAEGVTYSKEAYYVKVTIHDNGKGLLEVTDITYYSDKFVTPVQDGADEGDKVDGGEIRFTNHYGPGYIDLELDIDKAFRVQVGTEYESYIYKLTGSEFDFQVFDNEACTGDPVTVGTNGASDSNGVAQIIFGSIVIKKDQLTLTNGEGQKYGVFTYYIKEVQRSGATHIETDTSVIKVEITVTDDGWGNLTAAYVYTNAATGSNQTFTNTYKPADVSVTLEVDKHLTGKELTDETFTFALTDTNGVEVGTWTKVATGEYSVRLNFTAQDLAGVELNSDHVYSKTFTYVLSEKSGTASNANGTYTYDNTKYTVTVTLTDNGSGKLLASTEVKKGNDVVNSIVFNNTYTPDPINIDLSVGIEATKSVEDPNGNTVSYLLAGHQFKVYDLSGNPVIGADGAEIVGVSGADGKISFPKFQFSAAGESRYRIKEVIPAGAVQNADGTYTYQGMTYDMSEWCTHILVRYDAQTGKLYINDGSETNEPDDVYTHLFSGEAGHGDSGIQTQSEETPVFRNSYDPADVSVTITAKKLLEGRDLKDHEFTFRLLNADGTIAAETRNHADGTVSFHLNYELADLAGVDSKSFTYTMVEVIPNDKLGGVSYSTQSFAVTVTVTDNKAGALVVTIGGTDYSDHTYSTGSTFANTYSAKETTAQVTAMKYMDGTKPLGANDYTFRLEGSGINLTAKNDANGKIVFDLPAYTAAGVYTYTMKEVAPTIIGGGMTYDETKYTVTVTVTDDLKGQLHADVVYTDEDGNVYAIPVFTNSYLANGVQAVIEADKVLTGKALTAGEFTFKLFDAEGNELDSVTNDVNGNVIFTPIAFGSTGVYTFTISEVKGDNAGMTYDETVFDVTVTVTDENFDGQLDVEVAYSKNGTAVTGVPKFQNTYKAASVDVQISAEKDLNGKDLEAEEFSFNLVGNGENLTAKNDTDGKITFPKITIDAADMVDENGDPVANKSFQYTITEVKGSNPGMAYDVSKYVATVIVTDDGKGHLSAVVEYTKDQVTISTDVPVFTNSYVPGSVNVTIEAEKVLNGKTLVAGQFAFELKAEDGTVLATLTNDADGKIVINPITYTDAKVYTYTLSEVKGNAQGMTYDATVYTITVTVTDDGNGQLVAATEYKADGKVVEKITFTNTYKGVAATVDVTAKKVLEGKSLTAGAYTFKLVNKDNAEEFYTADNAADGTITFQDLRFTEPGVYTYLMSEVKGSDSKTAYDDTVYTVTITVTDDLQGSLKAVVDFGGKTAVFTNVYTPDPIAVPLKGSKELSGRDQVAGEFTFEVRDAEGKLITTGTNAADGTILFEDVKVYKAGEAVLYITEVAGNADRMTYDGYTYRVKLVVTNDNGVLVASVTYLDGDIVFYNEYQPDVPLTGDDTPVGLYAGLLGTSLLALAAVLVLYRKKETV